MNRRWVCRIIISLIIIGLFWCVFHPVLYNFVRYRATKRLPSDK
uniref:GIIM domain-containing protein n=1 Tax=Mesocestoides corti TaxID=53468 RepID=A0A5K3EY36_MESCO